MIAPVLLWLIVAAIAAVGEVLTTGLFLATAAVAALLTAVVAVFLPGALQVLAFSGLTLVGLAAVRPVVVRGLGIDSRDRPHGPVLGKGVVGRRALVTMAVDAHQGQIRVGQGEFWSARSFDPSVSIAEGTSVEVMMVEGITAIVAPTEDSTSLPLPPISTQTTGE